MRSTFALGLLLLWASVDSVARAQATPEQGSPAPTPAEGSAASAEAAKAAAPVSPAPVSPAPAAPNQVELDALTQTLAETGCAASSLVTRAERYYAVCGESSVWVLRLNAAGALQIEAKHRIPGKVRGLFVQSEEVWVTSSQDHAQPLRDTALDAQAVTAIAGPPLQEPVAVPTREGVVISSLDQEVTLSIGKRQGLKLGERVEVYTTKTDALDASLEGDAMRDESVLVGTITAVSDSRARITVGFGERVDPGMKARATNRPRSEKRMAPERIGDQLLLEGSVRPFLPVDKVAFAAQGDVAATYLPTIDAYARVELRPLGLLVGKGNSPSYAGAYASAGYDQTYFSLGLGVGLLYSERTIHYNNGYYDSQAQVYRQSSPSTTEDQTQFSVLQHVRLGARDGLHFAATTAVKLRGDAWEFGWFEGLVQMPIGSRSWGVLRGSGSPEPSYFFAEFGFRRLVRGNGGPGSLFLRPTAGVAGIMSPRSDAIGPLIGFHVEGRFAH